MSDKLPNPFDDLGHQFEQFKRHLPAPGRWVTYVLAAIFAITLASTSYYQIEPEEVGAVTRFGRYTHTAGPGPHWKIPFGVDVVQKVPAERQLKQEFGFRTTRPGIQTEFHKDEKTLAEATMLTGDLNVATVEWVVQYKISDPFKYLFNVRDVEMTFRLMSEAVMRQVVGDHNVTELLTVGREAIAASAKEALDALCRRYEIGISVQQLVLQDVDPPELVRPSFNEVNQAIQERERAINEAWAEYNQEIPRAGGLAEQQIQAAEGYAVERTNRAKGDASRFLQLQQEYAKAPHVTRTRIYLETLGDVLPNAARKVVMDDKGRGLLPLMDVGKDGKEVKP